MPEADTHQSDLVIAPPSGEHPLLLGMPAVICSAPMRQLMHLVKRVAQTNAAVLITGESGSGKEAVARAIHAYSLRCAMPWVDVNCAALPDHLVESELFGYEKGAFSGADSSKPGLFELADKGTLFLDEISEMEPKIQVKLLRVLDGAPYYRLGGRRKVCGDVRIVAATNQDLEEAMRSFKFRKDLYHRLNQVHIKVPPLRDRAEAIVPIAEFFLRQHDPRIRFAPDAKRALQSYSWPGNVRELRNVVTSAAILAENLEIRASDLPCNFGHSSTVPSRQPICGLDEMERSMILQVLAHAGGHHQKAADLLGISRRTLSRKLKLYGADNGCESPVTSERAETAASGRRREERKAAQGEVRLFWDEQPGLEQRGRLIDVSQNGFRAAHDYAAMSVGQEVGFRHMLAAGIARVVWSRILDHSVESGFLILQRAI